MWSLEILVHKIVCFSAMQVYGYSLSHDVIKLSFSLQIAKKKYLKNNQNKQLLSNPFLQECAEIQRS